MEKTCRRGRRGGFASSMRPPTRPRKKNLKVAAGTQRRPSPQLQFENRQAHPRRCDRRCVPRCAFTGSMAGPIWHRGDQGKHRSRTPNSQTGITTFWLCGDHICEQHVHNIDHRQLDHAGPSGQVLGHGCPSAIGGQIGRNLGQFCWLNTNMPTVSVATPIAGQVKRGMVLYQRSP